jgi:hydrogenase nickel incorporation protein HypB
MGGDGQEHDHVVVRRGARTVRLEEDVLAKNDAVAEDNRRWFRKRGIVALNLTSAPGSGKTTLLEKIVERLRHTMNVAVIEGDQETDRDAERLRRAGCAVVQINTGTGCHLDASMVRKALEVLEPKRASLVLIENVGNLVCPALFDLGERAMIVVMSVTEGEDKPLKYPHMFRAADAIVVNKIDLLPHLDFDLALCLRFIGQVSPHARVFLVSATSGDGMDDISLWMANDVGRAAQELSSP